MGLVYHRKKDNFDKDNTADPWNTIYGTDYGKNSKADSQKESYIIRSATEDLPSLPKDEEELSEDCK